MSVPSNPKIYHIVHVDRLPLIVEKDGLLFRCNGPGADIGRNNDWNEPH